MSRTGVGAAACCMLPTHLADGGPTGRLLRFTGAAVSVDLHEPVDDFSDGLAKFRRSVAVLLDARVLGDHGLLLAVTNHRLLVNLLPQNHPATRTRTTEVTG